MEKEGIVIDVSHASEALFYDVAENTERPFIATHSNSKELCKHPRNLTDDQFRIICSRGGLVGLNYFKAFLNDDPPKAESTSCLSAARTSSPWAAILTAPTCRMALRVSNP